MDNKAVENQRRSFLKNASLFALPFFLPATYLNTLPFALEKKESLSNEAAYEQDFPMQIYRKKILAQALASSFLARYETENMQISTRLLEKTFEKYPDYLSYADINLLHNLSFLKTVAFYKDLGEFNQFDAQLEEIGQQLLKEAPNNPYVNIYLGTYYDRLGEKEKARSCFKSIVEAKNFSQWWYIREAQSWLNENK